METETVTIVVPQHPEGRVVINKADYDPAVHTLAEPEADPVGLEEGQAAPGPDPAKPEPTPAKPAKPGKAGK